MKVIKKKNYQMKRSTKLTLLVNKRDSLIHIANILKMIRIKRIGLLMIMHIVKTLEIDRKIVDL
jgi:hypothetical protein